MKKITNTLSEKINRNEQSNANSIHNINDRIDKCLEIIYELKNQSR